MRDKTSIKVTAILGVALVVFAFAFGLTGSLIRDREQRDPWRQTEQLDSADYMKGYQDGFLDGVRTREPANPWSPRAPDAGRA